ncbi:MAG: DUF1919 domain-containing protein [Lachnospiraceae bacterium]|nr:DUF1919 domain-containing protein [Lachnospiraceae bacterium]
MTYKAVIWGIGKIYNRMANVLNYFKLKKQLEVLALTAHELPPYHEIDGFELVQKEKIQNWEYDLLIVMNERNFDDIVEEAVHICNVPREKIVPYWVFEIPRLDLDRYMYLRKSRISIVSNNCWGGIIYKTLGLEALSPFKNLFVEDEDYIRLVKNLRHYMDCAPQFCEYNTDIHCHEQYPVLLLDDIRIHCNHDKEAEEAIAKWNRRKEKINWDNLCIEMYTDNPKVEEEFMNIDGFARRVCFVPYESQYKETLQLKIMPGQREFYEAVNENANNGRNAFAYNLLDLLQMNVTDSVRSR